MSKDDFPHSIKPGEGFLPHAIKFYSLIYNHSYYNPALKKSDSFLRHPPGFQANCQVPVIKTMYQQSGTVQ